MNVKADLCQLCKVEQNNAIIDKPRSTPSQHPGFLKKTNFRSTNTFIIYAQDDKIIFGNNHFCSI